MYDPIDEKSGHTSQLKMWERRMRRVSAVACTPQWASSVPPPTRVHLQQRDHGDVIKVRMGHEDVVDADELLELRAPHAGPCIDQHIVIDEQGRGALIASADSAAAIRRPATSS